MTPQDLEPLMAILGHPFQDETLLRQALTHRSATSEHNERLEFLGDALLNFIVAQELYTRYPSATEGDLSRLRSQLVNGDHLARIGQALNLGTYLRLGHGEHCSGGRQRRSMLADATEAVLGAIYLDSDLTTCQRCVQAWYGSQWHELSPDAVVKDSKSELQEYVQAHQHPLPTYQVDTIQGQAHNQTFHVTAHVPGLPHRASGQGRTRRKAEQAAAHALLGTLQDAEMTPDNNPSDPA